MGRAFRSALALTIAFALVASTAAWRQCTALQLAAPITAIDSNYRHHAATDHGAHDHHATHQHPMADDPATPAVDDHGCMKCCTMCSVANAMLPPANATLTFTASAHVFFQRHETWSGKTLAVDPGIPKRIV
jgi:ABC-type nickel/cobalt efflux system permease component RcnA